MSKLLLASATVLLLGAAAPAIADDVSAGATGGAVVGATTGFFIGGPIGAIVGGTLGAGTGAAISASDEDYVRAHRQASITYDGDVRVGMRVRHSEHLYAIPDDSNYSYVYVNDQAVLIDNRNDTVVWVAN